MSLRLSQLYISRGLHQAKLDELMANYSGYDSSIDGESITANIEQLVELLEYDDKAIAIETARNPWQRRVRARAY